MPKRVARPKPKSKATSLKPEPVKNRVFDENKLRRIILGVALVFVAFFLYVCLQHGSLQGFWLEHQQFPGANAPSLVAARRHVQEAMGKANTAIQTTAPLYASGQVTNEDGCAKGVHDGLLGIKPRHDDFAYQCSLDVKQYFAFSQSRCDVSAAFLKLPAIFVGNACDTTTANDNFYSTARSTYGNTAIVSVMVQDVGTFKLENKDQIVGAAQFNPCHFDVAHKAYCANHDMPTNIADALPVATQTVVTVSTEQLTYYRK